VRIAYPELASGFKPLPNPPQRGELKKTQSLIWLRFFYLAILNIQQGFLLIIESKKVREIAEANSKSMIKIQSIKTTKMAKQIKLKTR